MSRLRAQILDDISAEREYQLGKWGEQTHPLLPEGTAAPKLERVADYLKRLSPNGGGSWFGIILEEFAETFAEQDPVKLREEAIQTAACLVAMVEQIDRKYRDLWLAGEEE